MSGKSVLGGLSALQWKKKKLTNILISLLVPFGAEQPPHVLGRAVIPRLWAKSQIRARQNSPGRVGWSLAPCVFTGRKLRNHWRFER